MKTLRIGSGAGYGGDRIEPAVDLIHRGNLSYLIFECLAERTIALAQLEKLGDPEKGYNPLFTYRMAHILPALKEHPVTIITNMGAANPIAAARKARAMADEAGLSHLRIAAVTGDDVMPILSPYLKENTMETGRPPARTEKQPDFRQRLYGLRRDCGGAASGSRPDHHRPGGRPGPGFGAAGV